MLPLCVYQSQLLQFTPVLQCFICLMDLEKTCRVWFPSAPVAAVT
ncbi:hypothetical protein A2U01_0118757, partial [Trifolium medium]|nr:hypothetical protein [Trifolium medium]